MCLTMLLPTRLCCLMSIILLFLTDVSAFERAPIDRFSPTFSWDRTLQGTAVTTSACDNIRTRRFPAKLELVYFYIIESLNGPLDDLGGVQNGILRAVLDALHSCDEDGFPEYALDLAIDHEYSENGFCIPQNPDNACAVVKGRTDIYLDAQVNAARDIAYTAIGQALGDQSFMLLYEPSIVRSRFEESIQENLIIPASKSSAVDDDETTKKANPAVKVAIAISSVAFVVASIFSYGFLRRQSQLNARCRATIERRQQGERKKAARRSRRYFSPLESDDGTPDDGPIIHLARTYDDTRSGGGWSVSDITSDSGSVQSILSRTTSRLEKIEEEPTVGDYDHAEIETAIQKELAVQTAMDDEVALSSHYTAAYVAHKSRLRDIVKNALFESEEEEVVIDEGDEENQRITPKTEESKSTSFGSPDSPSMQGSPAPLLLAEPSELSTLGHYHTPESAKTDGGLISVLTMDEFPDARANESNDVSSFLFGLDLDLTSDSRDSGASLQQWLARLLHELKTSPDIKRIEL